MNHKGNFLACEYMLRNAILLLEKRNGSACKCNYVDNIVHIVVVFVIRQPFIFVTFWQPSQLHFQVLHEMRFVLAKNQCSCFIGRKMCVFVFISFCHKV